LLLYIHDRRFDFWRVIYSVSQFLFTFHYFEILENNVWNQFWYSKAISIAGCFQILLKVVLWWGFDWKNLDQMRVKKYFETIFLEINIRHSNSILEVSSFLSKFWRDQLQSLSCIWRLSITVHKLEQFWLEKSWSNASSKIFWNHYLGNYHQTF
jgi:hypothetical protein